MRSRLRQAAAAAAMVPAFLAMATATAPAAGERAELDVPFKVATPATQSGLNLTLRYLNPADRNAPPPAITKVVLRLPEGTRIDGSAVPVCEATNEEIQARGRAACPPESKVGEGKLIAYTGSPLDPVRNDVGIYNAPGELIEIITYEGTAQSTGVDRLKIEGNVLTGNPPFVPGAPPDGRTSVSEITWDVPATGGFLVTPPTCTGTWTSVGEFAFDDGGTTTVTASQPCQRQSGGTPPPGGTTPPGGDGPPSLQRSLKLSASPRTFIRGRRTRVRVRLTSSDPACVRGATVRIGKRMVRTNSQGRATLVALVRHLRRPHLRVATVDCGTVRLALRTRRR